MPATYPPTLPGPATYSMEPAMQLAITGDDGLGPIQYRRQTRNPGATASATFRYLKDQYKVFLAWWLVDLLYGHRWFTIRLPSAGGITSHTVRFASKFKADKRGYRYVEVSCNLEILERRFEPLNEIPQCDPHFDKVALQCDFEGGTLATAYPTVVSNGGNTLQVLSSQFGGTDATDKKFGNRSVKLVGASSSLSFVKPSWIPSYQRPSYAPRTADFCLEVWAKYPLGSTGAPLLEFMFNSSTQRHAYLYYKTGGGFDVYQMVAIGNTPVIASGDGIPLDTWFHLAWARSGGISRIFINGTVAANWTDTYDYNIDQLRVNVPSHVINGNTNICYYDELRMTVGNGRYSEAFAPPTDPFVKVPCVSRDQVASFIAFNDAENTINPVDRLSLISFRNAPATDGVTVISKVKSAHGRFGTPGFHREEQPYGYLPLGGLRTITDTSTLIGKSWCAELHVRVDGWPAWSGAPFMRVLQIGEINVRADPRFNIEAGASASTAPTLVLGQWYHICLEFNYQADLVTLYVDGEPVSTKPGFADRSNPVPIGVGSSSGNGDYYWGAIDDWRLTTGIRYGGPFTSPTAPLDY